MPGLLILSGDNKYNLTIALADWISTGKDLFMVMGHELIHAWMIGYHGDTIASIEEHLCIHSPYNIKVLHLIFIYKMLKKKNDVMHVRPFWKTIK